MNQSPTLGRHGNPAARSVLATDTSCRPTFMVNIQSSIPIVTRADLIMSNASRMNRGMSYVSQGGKQPLDRRNYWRYHAVEVGIDAVRRSASYSEALEDRHASSGYSKQARRGERGTCHGRIQARWKSIGRSGSTVQYHCRTAPHPTTSNTRRQCIRCTW